MNSNCPLCKLVRGDIKTKLYWKDGLSICVDCQTCKKTHPIVVINRHDSVMNPEEEEHIILKTQKYFKDRFVEFRKEPRQIKNHAHYHIILK